MANYLPHYTKKKAIFWKRVCELRHAVRHELSPEKIGRATERVREARIRVLNAELAQIPPVYGEQHEAKRRRFLEAIGSWRTVPADDIVEAWGFAPTE